MTKNLNIRIEIEMLAKFQKFCEANGYCVSKRLRSYIIKDLNNNGKEKDKKSRVLE